MHYLFWCAFDHLPFRIPEFESICRLMRIPYIWVAKNDTLPWIVLDLTSDCEARQILSRSLSTKHCIQLWGQGSGYPEFHQSLRSFDFSKHSELLSETRRFKINVESFQRKTSIEERIQRIESMDYFPAKGEVDLKNPDVEFSYLEFWGLDNNNLPDSPCNVFFGVKVGEGQRHLISTQSIKTRKFIGNTTMDTQLALLMANLGMVQNGSFVLDPFVGTGSLLLAAAQFKGIVFGGDIDYLTLHARSRPSRVGEKVRGSDESMLANFEQYGLTGHYGDVIACDFSKSPWRQNLQFDLIVTDPPYGIREQMTKVGTDKDYSQDSIPEEYMKTHVPEKVPYSLQNILEDLLNFSADRLSIGGRLVYWLPVIRQEYKDEYLPQHPGLKLLYNCEQVLTSHTARRLIVMQKIVDVEAKASVPHQITKFKDQYYVPLAGNISRKERKKRLKEHGHLNISQEEMSSLKPYWRAFAS